MLKEGDVALGIQSVRLEILIATSVPVTVALRMDEYSSEA